jgi:uncharacterized protein involved in exopolysaccharide biosynthesis
MNPPPDKTATSRLSRASVVPQQPAPPRPVPAPSAAAAAAAAAGAPPPGGGPDVGAMIRRVFAHWHTVIVTLALGAIVTYAVVRSRTPTFKSETVIFFREGISKTVTGDSNNDTLKTLGTKLKETLLAQQSLRRVIDEFHLYPDIVQKTGYADAVDLMRKKTDFKSRSADTFAISYEGPTRELAQKVTARMADLLVSSMAKRQEEETKQATEFLDIEKKRSDEDLERVQRKTSAFLAAHPEFLAKTAGIGTTATAAEEKKAAKEAAAAKSHATATNVDRRSRRAGQAAPALQDDQLAAVDPMIVAEKTRAQNELLAAKKDYAEKSLKFTEQHPDVRAAVDRLAQAQAAFDSAKADLAAAAGSEGKPPRAAPAGGDDDPYGDDKPKAGTGTGAGASSAPAARAETPEAPRDLDQGASLEIEFERLERELTLAHTHASDLETKLYHAEMVASTNESGYGTTIAVLDPAFRPSGPSNLPNRTVVLVGLFASIAVGLVLSAAWGLFLDDRVFSPTEIEGIVMVPVIGTVPRVAKPKKGDKSARRAPAAPSDAAPAGRAEVGLGRIRSFFRRRAA